MSANNDDGGGGGEASPAASRSESKHAGSTSPPASDHSSPPHHHHQPGSGIEKRVHISNIPFQWREADLFRLFSPFGETKHVEIVYNERGSKGFGFVTFVNVEDADRAAKCISGQILDGRLVEVNEATNRARKVVKQEARDAPRPFMVPNLCLSPNPAASSPLFQPQLLQHQQQTMKFSPNLGAVLLQQKQMLAQQQLQQFLLTQQQTDLIATALGLPTSNIASLLAGFKFPCMPALAPAAPQPRPPPAVAAFQAPPPICSASIDHLTTLSMQQLQALPQLQLHQPMQQQHAPPLQPMQQQPPPAVNFSNLVPLLPATTSACVPMPYTPSPSPDMFSSPPQYAQQHQQQPTNEPLGSRTFPKKRSTGDPREKRFAPY